MYDQLNKMLYNPEGLQHQDDIKGQLKVLQDITTEKLKKWVKIECPKNGKF